MDGAPTELAVNKNESLVESGDIRIIKPNSPAIPASEGSHLQVTTGEQVPWRQRPAKELLRMAFYALPTAKVLAEGRDSEDLWANIHLNSRPPFEGGVNVFGRNPESATGWGKPVTLRDLADGVVPESAAKPAEGPVLDRYLHQWERLLPQVELFPEGVGELPSESQEFQEEDQALGPNEKLIWANGKFSLVVIKSPHLSGLHLVVHPNQKYWGEKGGFKRAWQVDKSQDGQGAPQEHVQGFLEAVAIINGAERVLIEEGKLPFYNPETHFSGNWTPDFQPPERGGSLDTSYLSQTDLEKARKEEKREHRVGGVEEWQTAMHGHLYATRDPNTYVSLPARPEKEVPQEWEGITPLTDDEEGTIKTLIAERLTPWLEQNAMGSLNS